MDNLQRLNRRYGQVVRQWIANPLSPVRIWVPPDIDILDCFFFKQRYNLLMFDIGGHGEIGRHDRLKICCLVIGVRVQIPLSPFELRAAAI